MVLEIITDEIRLIEVASQWETLSAKSKPSMSPRWLLNWWSCYKNQNLKLKIYCIWEKNEVVLLIPMMIEITSKGKLLRFLSHNCSDYLGVVTSANNREYIDMAIAAICDDTSWDMLFLNNIDGQDETTRSLFYGLINRGFVASVKKQDCIAKIELSQPWHQFIDTKSKNVRHAYSKIGRVSNQFEFVVYHEYNFELIESVINLHILRWEKDHQVSTFFDERRKRFLHKIAKDFSDVGKLKVFVLKNNKKIIAYRLGLIDQNTYFDWNTAYNPKFAEYSCGKILIQNVYKYLFENNVHIWDFMKGMERYKTELMTQTNFLYSISCTRETEICEYIPPMNVIKNTFRRVGGVIFDLDGVVYSGDKPIGDTIELIDYLQKKGIKIGFLTNTSSKSIEQIRKKLRKMRVNTEGCYIMTSAIATGIYLRNTNCNLCVVFGSACLRDEIKKCGVDVYSGEIANLNGEKLDVIIGYTKDFLYDDLVACSQLLNYGGRLICTDADNRFAYNGKWMPGTGWIVSSLNYVNNCSATIIGKPGTFSLQYIIEEMNLSAEELLLIGDNLTTDIKAAKKMKIASCLLLGGVSRRAEVATLPNDDRPDLVVDSLLKICNLF